MIESAQPGPGLALYRPLRQRSEPRQPFPIRARADACGRPRAHRGPDLTPGAGKISAAIISGDRQAAPRKFSQKSNGG